MKDKYLILILAAVVLLIGGVALLIVTNNDSENSRLSSSNDITSESSNINAKTLEVGQKAPDFSVITIDGIGLTLSDFDNKILVLTSGAAWCPTCIIENKNFMPVHDEVKDDGIEFMTVDIDSLDSEEAIKEFQKLYAPWHNVHVSQGRELINDYGFWRFEITYIIDGDGIVRFKDLGITETDTLREELNKII